MTQLNSKLQKVILVIDDNAICLKIYEAYFANSGLNIKYMSDPNEALRLIENTEISGVITDLIMPGTSGLKILTAVAKHQKNCFKCLVTGNTDLDSIIWAVNEIGIDRVLFKPLNIKEENLISRMKSWIETNEKKPLSNLKAA